MPIGWMTVLQSVPWGEVVSNAPKIAAGARKLWKAVAARPAGTREAAVPPADMLNLSPEAQGVALLQTRVDALEAAAAQLHNQLAESSGLVAALAEQNTQLVARLEKMRVRIIWFGIAVSAGLLGLLAMLANQA